ncbi:MAG TPA: alpha/beta hydrolase [Actinomycetota bacterium]|nr:alpha/beta hydrolase [Actinomycetota bacterium]
METGGIGSFELVHWIWPPVLVATAAWLWHRSRRRLTRWRKVAAGAALSLTALIGLGGTYESIGAAVDLRRYEAPGALVELADGRRMHLNCSGSGAPTVVLEALSGGASPGWGWIQRGLSEQVRVCSYDRPGRGWSDPVSEPQDAREIAGQLAELLDRAQEPGPYVLVGHSLGGLYARMFADRYPERVAGMVLLDAAHPEQFERQEGAEDEHESYRSFQKSFAPMARLGIWRLYFDLGGTFDFGGLPPVERGQLKAIWSSPALFHSQRYENDAVRSVHRQVRPLGAAGDFPLMVITAGEQPEDWLELQEEMTELSPNATQRVIEGATHVSLIFDRQDAAQVTRGVLDVWRSANGSGPL